MEDDLKYHSFLGEKRQQKPENKTKNIMLQYF